MQNRSNILLFLSGLLPISLCVAAGIGAYQILPWRIPRILLFHEDGFEVLIYVRFPRVILAAIVGAVLAISGATLQGIFRNPLADPGLIGVTAGAGFGAATLDCALRRRLLGHMGRTGCSVHRRHPRDNRCVENRPNPGT